MLECMAMKRAGCDSGDEVRRTKVVYLLSGHNVQHPSIKLLLAKIDFLQVLPTCAVLFDGWSVMAA